MLSYAMLRKRFFPPGFVFMPVSASVPMCLCVGGCWSVVGRCERRQRSGREGERGNIEATYCK